MQISNRLFTGVATLGLAVLACPFIHQASASTIRGIGTTALRGGDLTDPENDGNPESNVGYNATFNASEEPTFGGSEAAFNVFDNEALNGGNSKFCCGDQNNFPTNPITIDATFPSAQVLLSFTATSSNDTPERDPRVWKIQGSNDGVNFTDIFTQNNPNATLWTARDQVLEFTAGTDFATPLAYTTIRFRAEASGLSSGARFALDELEYFNTLPVPEPVSGMAFAGLGVAFLSRRRRR